MIVITSLKLRINEVRSVNQTVTESKTEILAIRAQLEEVKKKNEEMQFDILELKEANAKLEDRIEDLEKYSRKNNMVISGIPVEKDENVKEIFTDLANQLQVELQDHEVCVIHQLPAQRNRTPGIIVKLSNNEKKQELIKQSRARKLRFGDTNIYVDDQLMAKTVVLVKEAKAMRDEGKLKYIWTKNGDLFVRVDDGERAQKITKREELVQVSKNEGRENRNKRPINQLSPENITQPQSSGKKQMGNDIPPRTKAKQDGFSYNQSGSNRINGNT